MEHILDVRANHRDWDSRISVSSAAVPRARHGHRVREAAEVQCQAEGRDEVDRVGGRAQERQAETTRLEEACSDGEELR
eukprot:1195713-Prorocentrum_minimum.AAC.8